MTSLLPRPAAACKTYLQLQGRFNLLFELLITQWGSCLQGTVQQRQFFEVGLLVEQAAIDRLPIVGQPTQGDILRVRCQDGIQGLRTRMTYSLLSCPRKENRLHS